jgi:hypothetical protein
MSRPCTIEHCLENESNNEKQLPCCAKILHQYNSEQKKRKDFKKATGKDYDDTFNNTYGIKEKRTLEQLIEEKRINDLLEQALNSKVAKDNQENMGHLKKKQMDYLLKNYKHDKSGSDDDFIEQLREEGYFDHMNNNITDKINPMKSSFFRRTFKSFLPSKKKSLSSSNKSRGGKRKTKHIRKNKKRSTYNNKK